MHAGTWKTAFSWKLILNESVQRLSKGLAFVLQDLPALSSSSDRTDEAEASSLRKRRMNG